MAAQKNRPQLSNNAGNRMGIYKIIDSVPDRYRLQNYSSGYTGTDVWNDYFVEKIEKFDTRSTHDRYEKAGRYFKSFMQEVGRHHALADPSHIEEFLISLRDGDIGRYNGTRTLQTVYFEYFQPIEEFYSWLQWHTDHPHVYHPVLMAVVDGGFANEVWKQKLEQNDKR